MDIFERVTTGLPTLSTELNLSEPSCELGASGSDLVIHRILVLNNKLKSHSYMSATTLFFHSEI